MGLDKMLERQYFADDLHDVKSLVPSKPFSSLCLNVDLLRDFENQLFL